MTKLWESPDAGDPSIYKYGKFPIVSGMSDVKSLRQIISEAYDEVTHKQEEKKMDTAGIVAEAAKERTTRLAEKLLDEFWEFFDGVTWVDGDTFAWSAKFKPGEAVTYRYVAVFSGGAFYVTGRTGALSTAELISELVRIKLDAVEFTSDTEAD